MLSAVECFEGVSTRDLGKALGAKFEVDLCQGGKVTSLSWAQGEESEEEEEDEEDDEDSDYDDEEDDYDDYEAESAPVKKAVLQIDELSDLRSTFEACDSDKSGGMDLSEFVTVLRLWEVDRDANQLAKELMSAAKEGCANQPAAKAEKFQLLLDAVGLPWSMLEPPVLGDDELNFSEFMYMLNSGVRSSSCS